MTYLTKEEFLKLGFEDVEDFEKLLARASLTIDLYLKNFYDFNDFETDFDQRKQSTVGRTHVSYQNGSKSSHDGKRFNLSLDALNWLTLAGFGCKAVDYDR